MFLVDWHLSRKQGFNVKTFTINWYYTGYVIKYHVKLALLCFTFLFLKENSFNLIKKKHPST